MMRFPLFDATGGMVLMAEMESRDLHELLKDEEDQDKIPGILAQLDEIRRQGFVVADSRLVPGAGAIATVIRDSGGAPVAAATLISSPDDIAARQDLLVRRVRDFADKIQHAIPHRPR